MEAGIWDRIFNDPGVRQHRRVVEVLGRLQPDFETAFADILDGDYSEDEQGALRESVRRIFNTMDGSLRNLFRWDVVPSLGGTTDLIRLSSGNSSECGFFFTLNQDLFVERWIMDKTEPDRGGQLRHLGIGGSPGMGRRALGIDDVRRIPVSGDLPGIVTSEEKNQHFAYVKLHGSTGWVDSIGQGAMVIGGGKERQIRSEPLLNWYFDLFRQVMLERPHRLLVIGYGFRDRHVNQVLAHAIRDPGLDIAALSPQPWCKFKASLDSSDGSSDSDSVLAIRDCFLSPNSRYFQRGLVDVLPPESQSLGAKTEDWLEIRSYLRE